MLNHERAADAAFFLGVDSLLVPSARWPCLNLVVFTDRVEPHQVELVTASETPIDWQSWRKWKL